jgi:membrane dipeptidase
MADSMKENSLQTNTPRRRFLLTLGALAAAPLLPTRGLRAAALAGSPDWPGYRDAIVIDALGGPAADFDETGKPIDAKALEAVRISGITAVNLTISGVGSYARNYDETVRNIAWWNAQIAAHPERLLAVRNAADIDEAKRSGRLGIIYGFQDATPMGEDLDRVEIFHELGVRVFQLTYNRRNLVGDGCLEPGNAGLSTFGRSLVERLNARRALIDLSHAGERTTLEAIEASKVPIAISHTGCAAVAANPRNKTDNELKRLADKGGVAGMYLMPFLRTRGQPMAEDLLKHLEHAVDICGEDHVGIGTDGTISPIDITPEFKRGFAEEVERRRKLGISAPGEQPDVYTFLPDLNSADRFQRIAFLLSKRGHSDARIAKLIGGNFNRLFRETWGASK